MDIKNIENYEKFRKKAEISLMLTCDDILIENTPCIKRPILEPRYCTNKCKMYFDDSSLPPSCADITDLSNKCVIYGIYCKDKFYIGSTTDFGDRMMTHVKDSRKIKQSQKLYSNMMNNECISFVIGIVKDETTLRQVEHTIIKECKDYSIARACNFNDDEIKFIKESTNDSKRYAKKYCYNISD